MAVPSSRTLLLEKAARWRAADPDPLTRRAMDDIIERADEAELVAVMEGSLEFGTAGIRGPLGPGPNRMNRVVVRQTAAGLARVLLEDGSPSLRTAGVVVGHDARHGSDEFAADVVDVISSHGIPVRSFTEAVPTPLVAFTLVHVGAAAAVVITASHNPATDNGIKVYWSDGAQIVPPAHDRISVAISTIRNHEQPVVPQGEPATVVPIGGAGSDDDLVLAYVDHALGLSAGGPRRSVPLALTSLHGVGATLLERVLSAAGHGPLHAVVDQREPDPDFPTVAFPNPEEPGALDRLLDLARAESCGLAIANDPDADRLALAAPTPDGSWRALTGDETGAVLAAHLLDRTEGIPDRLIATTVVSSRLTRRMADAAGVHFVETLTGFKWLCRPGIEHPEWHQLLLYEEALGYAIGPGVRDKDGITAALVAADLAVQLAAAGRSVWDVLDDLAVEHGAHVTSNGSIRLDADGLDRASERIWTLADDPARAMPGRTITAVDRPAHDVLRLWLADETRVVIRPSGTEPKVKYYCEAVEPVGTDGVVAARGRAQGRLDDLLPHLRSLLAG